MKMPDFPPGTPFAVNLEKVSQDLLANPLADREAVADMFKTIRKIKQDEERKMKFSEWPDEAATVSIVVHTQEKTRSELIKMIDNMASDHNVRMCFTDFEDDEVKAMRDNTDKMVERLKLNIPRSFKRRKKMSKIIDHLLVIEHQFNKELPDLDWPEISQARGLQLLQLGIHYGEMKMKFHALVRHFKILDKEWGNE